MTSKELARLVGERVCARRKALGLSQQELALRAEMSPNTLRHAEHGQGGFSVFTLWRLAGALRCEPAELLPKGEEPES